MFIDERNFQVPYGQVPRATLYPNVEVKNFPSNAVAFKIEIHIVKTLIPKLVCPWEVTRGVSSTYEAPSSNTS